VTYCSRSKSADYLGAAIAATIVSVQYQVQNIKPAERISAVWIHKPGGDIPRRLIRSKARIFLSLIYKLLK
jgi:hypothetical protein